jgi:predicted nucleic acid-binding protein
LSTDLLALTRRRKPEKWLAPITLRDRGDLVGATTFAAGTGTVRIVPDTTVYIDHAADRLPPAALALFNRSLTYHCSVCLSELVTGLSNADPSRAGWAAKRDYFAELFRGIPATRLLTPDADIWADAGMISGTLARTQGFQRHQRKECLNDALIYLTAAKAGMPVLTANRDDFDLIHQLAPEGRFVHY